MLPLPETSFLDKKLRKATLALTLRRLGRVNAVHAMGPEEPGSPPRPSNMKPADARARAAPSCTVPTFALPVYPTIVTHQSEVQDTRLVSR